jgi:hypothetical protein
MLHVGEAGQSRRRGPCSVANIFMNWLCTYIWYSNIYIKCLRSMCRHETWSSPHVRVMAEHVDVGLG